MNNTSAIELPDSFPLTLLVVVDTEEEFDWYGDFDRQSTSVEATAELHKLQAVFDEYGVRPVYVIDYPIASTPKAVDALRPIVDDGRAEIGGHLHTWVSPPYTEEVNRRNSFQRNLPMALEHEKLKILKSTIVEAFERDIVIHKAGRYGIGDGTAQNLVELGFEIDISVVPAFDYSDDGGPDFRHLGQELFRFGPGNGLFGIPNTGAFIGCLAQLGPTVYQSQRQSGRAFSLFARALSKSRLLERIMLSPEGHTIEKMIRLTKVLQSLGSSVFTLSLHSPTVMAGGTPYATTGREVAAFLDKCKQYFDFFFNELGGRTLLPSELKAEADRFGNLT